METFSALLAICTQRPVTRSFGVSFICAWMNGWVNTHEAGDKRRHLTHYDVRVMYERVSILMKDDFFY